MKSNCIFHSVWDGVDLPSEAVYDPITGHIDVLKAHDVSGLEHLEREYIEFEGEEIDVCPSCHEHTLTPVAENTGVRCRDEYNCQYVMVKS